MTKVPAGFPNLGGRFLGEICDEIMHLVHNKVEEQKTEHPMERPMGVEDQPDGGVQITFTDMHLPCAAGEAVECAFEGDLGIQNADDSGIERVYRRR